MLLVGPLLFVLKYRLDLLIEYDRLVVVQEFGVDLRLEYVRQRAMGTLSNLIRYQGFTLALLFKENRC